MMRAVLALAIGAVALVVIEASFVLVVGVDRRGPHEKERECEE